MELGVWVGGESVGLGVGVGVRARYISTESERVQVHPVCKIA